MERQSHESKLSEIRWHQSLRLLLDKDYLLLIHTNSRMAATAYAHNHQLVSSLLLYARRKKKGLGGEGGKTSFLTHSLHPFHSTKTKSNTSLHPTSSPAPQ